MPDLCNCCPPGMQGFSAVGAAVPGSATGAYPGVNWHGTTPSLLDQCVVEQEYVRQSMTRTLLYAQVRRP